MVGLDVHVFALYAAFHEPVGHHLFATTSLRCRSPFACLDRIGFLHRFRDPVNWGQAPNN